jgi:hypothetical protein
MGTESLIGAAASGAFAGYTSAEVLKLLLSGSRLSLPHSRHSGGAFDARNGLGSPGLAPAVEPEATIRWNDPRRP